MVGIAAETGGHCGVNTDGAIECRTVIDSGYIYQLPQTATPTLSLSMSNGCMILEDGVVECWGPSDSRGPALTGLTGAKSISVGLGSACAVQGDGSVECVGEGVDGVPDRRFDQLACGLGRCCGLSVGDVHCWGVNHDG